MDYSRVGKLIFNLRKQKNMTQKELADTINISDRTVSKWERGIGCPDISLLQELSELFAVNIENILLGDLDMQEGNKGDMRQVKFYVCPHCSHILYSTGEAEISCCGRKLIPLCINREDESHTISVAEIEDDYYVTIAHEMDKSHYISFAAYVACDRVLLIKLYPEQGAELRFPKMHGGKLYIYCSRHGLWEKEK